MKLTDIIKVLFLSMAMLLSASCETDDPMTSDLAHKQVTIALDVDKLNLESASIRVRHDGAADLLWVYLLTEDLESDPAALIAESLTESLSSLEK